MPAPTTVLQYATQRSTKIKAAIATAQQQLAQAQRDSAAEEANVATAIKEFGDLEKIAAGIRQKLSAIPTPADGETLLAQLEQTIIQSRAKQAEIVTAQTALIVAQTEAGSAQSDLAASSAELPGADAALKKADPASTQRAAWDTALGGPPLASIKTSATNAIDTTDLVEGAAFTAAKTRIEADIPAKLLARAQDRRHAQSDRIANSTAARQAADVAVVAERDAHGGLAVIAADRWADLISAETAVRDFINSAQSRLDQAITTLVQVPGNAPLTVQQRASIEATGDNALKTKRETAATNEQDVADKRKDLEAKQKELDEAILSLMADPDDTTKQTTKGTKQSNVTAAEGLLATAETAYTTVQRALMDAWEAAVPDTTWQLLDDYEGAVEILQAMPTPATLRTALQTAETNYVTAQLTADKSADVLAALMAEQAKRAAQEESARQTSGASLFGALRGDN